MQRILSLSFIVIAIVLTACSKSGVNASKAASKNDTIPMINKPVKGWQQVASLPGPRTYATSFTLNNKGYVCGGVNDFTKSAAFGYDDMLMYEPDSNKWVQKAGLPNDSKKGRRYPFSFVTNNLAYAGGGITLNGVPEHDINVYDPVNNHWTTKTQISSSSAFDISFSIGLNNKGYIFSFPAAYENVYTYDPTTNTVVESAFAYKFTFLSINSWCATNDTTLFYGSASSYGFFFNVNILTNTLTQNDFPSVALPDTTVSHIAIHYKNCLYMNYGNEGNLYRYNFLKLIYEPVISQRLGINEGTTSFLIGSKYYVVGGNNGIFTPSTNKVWMIDLDAYPE